MPNWTFNKIKCNKKIANKILEKKDNEYIFDFNKIIPMPESLKITAGSIESKAVVSYYLSQDKIGRRSIEDSLEDSGLFFHQDYWNKYKSDIDYYLNNPDKLKQAEETFDGKLTDSNLTFNSLSELGKQYIDNIKQYGFSQWYDWSVEKWGTKWNVMEDIDVDIDNEEYTITFNTAWSAPYGIIEEYSKLCSDEEFNWEFENEDYDGYHILRKSNGRILEKIIDDRHEECYEEEFDFN